MVNMINSKLPDIGTTIFTTMSQLAVEHKALNLSQGFPDFDGPQYLKDRVCHYIQQGRNQYAPMSGVLELRQQIAAKTKLCYGREVDENLEVTVTSGATEALFAAIHALVQKGDEVVVFDPAYDSYNPAIRLAGGVPVHLELSDEFAIDFEQLRQAITKRTKLIIINSPHNPTGSVLNFEQMQRLENIVLEHGLYLISDEVYEHIIFDNEPHQSVNRFEALAERSFIISSFGKTFHTTGWKIGYCIAPKQLTEEFRKVHQYLTFCSTTPIQLGLADVLAQSPEHWQSLPKFYQQKRDYFRKALSNTSLKLLPCSGTYFQCVDYSKLSSKPDFEFAQLATEHLGIATIPISVFYQSKKQQSLVRLCFAKDETTLDAAAKCFNL